METFFVFVYRDGKREFVGALKGTRIDVHEYAHKKWGRFCHIEQHTRGNGMFYARDSVSLAAAKAHGEDINEHADVPPFLVSVDESVKTSIKRIVSRLRSTLGFPSY